MRAAVLEALKAVTGEADHWSEDKLYRVVDKGSFDGPTERERVWVLDPVDGTKGFMRGEHYCIALGLMVEGSPVLSVLGCPNMVLKAVLQADGKR